ncbi:MAG: hypothetical protein K1W21_13105, partial [Oscillospiraceae bacterium]
YMREVLAAVLNGGQGGLWDKFSEEQRNTLAKMNQDYAELKERYDESGGTDWEAGAELEALYEEAQGLGKAYFDNSAEVKRLNEIEEDEIAAIRENTAGLTEATQASYRLSQQLSKGRGAVYLQDAARYASREDYARRGREENALSSRGHITERRDLQGNRAHAYGLDRVPYDDYPALLHEGERVLTAGQARAQDAAQSAPTPIQLTITGNSFTGTPEEMADQLAEIIVRRLEQAAIAAAPK